MYTGDGAAAVRPRPRGDRPVRRLSRRWTAGGLLIGVQNDRGWVAFVRDVLDRPELADRSALCDERRPGGPPRGGGRPRRRGHAHAPGGGAGRPPGCGRDPERRISTSVERGGRVILSSRRATGGARSVRPVGRSARCCRRSRSTASRPGWIRSPRSASTPTRSCASWVTRRSDRRATRRRHRRLTARAGAGAAARCGAGETPRSAAGRSAPRSRAGWPATSTPTSTRAVRMCRQRMHDRQRTARQPEPDREDDETLRADCARACPGRAARR